MQVTPLKIEDIKLIKLDIFGDARGFFVERFHEKKFKELGLPTVFVQDNHSRSLPRSLRGLHFQTNPVQGKLVGVIRGKIWDVAVDLRPSSSFFGKWVAATLTDQGGELLWIPPGFGHGFCVLGDTMADVFYKVDAPYTPSTESGIIWNDPALAITWPVQDPIISKRDLQLESFQSYCVFMNKS